MATLAEMIAQMLQQPQQQMLGSGVAPGGLRHSGEGVKGLGYFGSLPHAGGSRSTELSSEFEIGGRTIEHPLMVPTLNAQELQHLLSGGEPTQEIYNKAQSHALYRISKGLSPFAGPTELRYPRPAP